MTKVFTALKGKEGSGERCILGNKGFNELPAV